MEGGFFRIIEEKRPGREKKALPQEARGREAVYGKRKAL